MYVGIGVLRRAISKGYIMAGHFNLCACEAYTKVKGNATILKLDKTETRSVKKYLQKKSMTPYINIYKYITQIHHIIMFTLKKMHFRVS